MTESIENVTVSVVSHGQGLLVEQLLRDLATCSEIAEIFVTQNIPESDIDCPKVLRSRVHFIRNEKPLGFAANHNQAFQYCMQPFFVVVNPDVVFNKDHNPFPVLKECVEKNGYAVVAPKVFAPNGKIENSARRFPTLFGLMKKLFWLNDGCYTNLGKTAHTVDWVAGMFMFFRSSDYRAIGGFDSRFFLYYEDVDICIRLWNSGCKVSLCPSASIIHDARRSSHRNLKYLKMHLLSMVLFFTKHWGRIPRTY